MSIKITVFYDESFWVGFFEKEENFQITVAKYTFGIEPRETEVLEFILKDYDKLTFSSPLKVEETKKDVRFKKRQKAIKKLQETTGVGTKAQQALKIQQEEKKVERKNYKKLKKEIRKKEQFQLKQEKRKEKHKGH